jgi:hypothetical protein
MVETIKPIEKETKGEEDVTKFREDKKKIFQED